MINTSRRQLITGLISFAAAPAIVRVQNIMPVKSYKDIYFPGQCWFGDVCYKNIAEFEKNWKWTSNCEYVRRDYDHSISTQLYHWSD